MVAMAVGNEHIVNGAEIDTHPLGITDQDVAGSRIKQDAMTLRLQEYRQPVLRCQCWGARAIIYQYSPLHTFPC